ncbi:MAG: single-stranded DNA-binding protein [Phytoplasma sp.]|uniref:single-stranded DNA-binding protein n=1 Tax=Phytoplasma sp. TaxID=2155 RepID=UPI002B40D38C|nr:single-stranded DNA-binding protein [Phytoplasma sp.]WRH06719.1 MAG: single-stranded DNA-binding protein [Phytoplasma sp.]
MLNKTFFIGRICHDLELKTFNSNKGEKTSLLNFTLAVGTKNKNKTDFIPMVSFYKQAELMKQYLFKGSLISVEGRLSINKFEDKNGNKEEQIQIIVENIVFLDFKKENVINNNPNPSLPF